MTGRETLRYVAGSTPPGPTRPSQLDEVLAGSGSPTRPTAGPARTRAACASGSGSPRPSSARPRSCSSMSRSARSTRSVGVTSSTSCASCGETTVFYSTHILDDVERVSDHVAILDHGSLVRAAPTADLLASLIATSSGSSSAAPTTPPRSTWRPLPGVVVGRAGRAHGDLEPTSSGPARRDPAVQAAITRFAADRDLTVTENHVVRLGLEDVFLRLVDSKERAA